MSFNLKFLVLEIFHFMLVFVGVGRCKYLVGELVVGDMYVI